jgi:RimJ/RimL family protein N-acetyltransferase
MERYQITPETLASGLDVRMTPVRTSDEMAVYRWCQDAAIQRYTTVPSPYTRQDAHFFTNVLTQEAWALMREGGWSAVSAAGKELVWAIRVAPGREYSGLVGVIGLHPGSEIGFWLAAELRGLGIASACARALCRYAFFPGGDIDVERITWRGVIGNMASQRTAWHCGFAYTGVGPGPVRCDEVDMWSAELLRGWPMTPGEPWPIG